VSARREAKQDEQIYRAGGARPARPLQLGDRVRAAGEVGVITAIDWSVATSTRIVTVQASPRIRMRIAERDVELIGGA
jgi:hypothetical protein